MRKHQSLIKKMTLEEKASLLSGENFWNTKAIERLDIPSIMLTDGPHGLRKQGGKADHLGLNASIPATCFPPAGTLANSWDTGLIEEVGEHIGREAAAEEVSVLLGPGLNIVRNPLGGRSFEYYSEDPFLSGRLAAAAVQGIQKNGIAASPKHFAVNSQEHLRMTIDEIVDERSLREIYLEGFRHVVEHAKPKTIMSAYNKVNGEYANENTHLLSTILQKEWGFKGVTVTDWGGENDRIAGLLAGNQLEMPSSNGITDREIVAAVRDESLDVSIVDDAVSDMLELILHTKKAFKRPSSIDFKAHHKKAVEAASRSMVLLKNDNGILPLKPKTRVAVIGDFAQNPRYQGAGSSLVNPAELVTTLDSLQASRLEVVGYTAGFHRTGGTNRRLLKQATELSRSADVALLFLGLDESLEAEGLDRPHMRLSDAQYDLVQLVTAENKNVVVVLSGGAPVELPFVKHVPAVLHGFLGGQGGGQAITDIITGKINPSGKLALTYPRSYHDVPSALFYPGKETTSEHREGIFVGYRYYDTADVPVLFPFGHGVSYTMFEYSDVHVGRHTVSWTVKNVGTVAGEEVGQVYIGLPSSTIPRARRELKGFSKVFLKPGESKKVAVRLDDHAFRYYNPVAARWVTEPGEYVIEIGASLEDIRLSYTVVLKGDTAPIPHEPEVIAAYIHGNVKRITSQTFSKLVGRDLPVPRWDRSKPLTLEDTVEQLRYANFIGKSFRGVILLVQRLFFLLNKPIAGNNVEFILALPFAKIDRFTKEKVSRKAVERFLKLVNK